MTYPSRSRELMSWCTSAACRDTSRCCTVGKDIQRNFCFSSLNLLREQHFSGSGMHATPRCMVVERGRPPPQSSRKRVAWAATTLSVGSDDGDRAARTCVRGRGRVRSGKQMCKLQESESKTSTARKHQDARRDETRRSIGGMCIA